MSALRRVLPAAVAFVVVGGSVYRKHSTSAGARGPWRGLWPAWAVVWGPGPVVRWWRLRRNRVIQ